jgi:uncharacterized repeat protein (TIGR02543 family)
LSQESLSAGSGTFIGDAVSGNILSKKMGDNNGNFILEYEVSNLNNLTFYFYFNSYFDQTGTYSMPWKYNYYKRNQITYYANDSEGTIPPTQYFYTDNLNVTISSVSPERTGYNFLGWSTSSTATSATYTAGTTYTLSA